MMTKCVMVEMQLMDESARLVKTHTYIITSRIFLTALTGACCLGLTSTSMRKYLLHLQTRTGPDRPAHRQEPPPRSKRVLI